MLVTFVLHLDVGGEVVDIIEVVLVDVEVVTVVVVVVAVVVEVVAVDVEVVSVGVEVVIVVAVDVEVVPVDVVIGLKVVEVRLSQFKESKEGSLGPRKRSHSFPKSFKI